MTKAIAKTYETTVTYRKQIAVFLLAACLTMVLAYIANVYRIIVDTVALQKTEVAITALNGRVGALDSDYIALSKAITPDAIEAHGFVQGQVSAYIPRTTFSGRVAIRGHEL